MPPLASSANAVTERAAACDRQLSIEARDELDRWATERDTQIPSLLLVAADRLASCHGGERSLPKAGAAGEAEGPGEPPPYGQPDLTSRIQAARRTLQEAKDRMEAKDRVQAARRMLQEAKDRVERASGDMHARRQAGSNTVLGRPEEEPVSLHDVQTRAPPGGHSRHGGQRVRVPRRLEFGTY